MLAGYPLRLLRMFRVSSAGRRRPDMESARAAAGGSARARGSRSWWHGQRRSPRGTRHHL